MLCRINNPGSHERGNRWLNNHIREIREILPKIERRLHGLARSVVNIVRVTSRMIASARSRRAGKVDWPAMAAAIRSLTSSTWNRVPRIVAAQSITRVIFPQTAKKHLLQDRKAATQATVAQAAAIQDPKIWNAVRATPPRIVRRHRRQDARAVRLLTDCGLFRRSI